MALLGLAPAAPAAAAAAVAAAAAAVAWLLVALCWTCCLLRVPAVTSSGKALVRHPTYYLTLHLFNPIYFVATL
jgi:hypothetical protein